MTYGDDRSASGRPEYASEKPVIDRRATTEAGGGVPQDVRQGVLAAAVFHAMYSASATTMRIEGANFNDIADAILAEIAAAAGYELVPADQLERVLAWAELAWVAQHFFPASMLPSSKLQPGDLDAPGGRE